MNEFIGMNEWINEKTEDTTGKKVSRKEGVHCFKQSTQSPKSVVTFHVKSISQYKNSQATELNFLVLSYNFITFEEGSFSFHFQEF